MRCWILFGARLLFGDGMAAAMDDMAAAATVGQEQHSGLGGAVHVQQTAHGAKRPQARAHALL
jgi:hypothetical protein